MPRFRSTNNTNTIGTRPLQRICIHQDSIQWKTIGYQNFECDSNDYYQGSVDFEGMA